MNHMQLWAGMLVLFCACSLPLGAASQKVVVAEDFTATWCTYCPGAARGLDRLDEENDAQLVVIAYHAADDPFYTADYPTRKSLYGIGGIPTVLFDGVRREEGGMHDGTMYSYYVPHFNARKAVANPIDIVLENSDLNKVKATVVNTSAGTVSGKIHFVVIQRHLAYGWQGMSELDYICRAMLPNANGESVSIAAGQSAEYERSFTIQPSWPRDDCRMVVFVQGTNKEIYQGAEISLPDTVPTLTLSQPNGGEIWEAGSTQLVTWQSQYMSGNVRIQFSTDGGGAWQTVAQNVSNTGQYSWRLPETVSGRCLVQVSEMDGSPGDVSNGTFGIYWPGDVNGDNFIDTQDMLLLADCLAEVLAVSLESDLNGDGVTNSVDLLILYYELAS